MERPPLRRHQQKMNGTRPGRKQDLKPLLWEDLPLQPDMSIQQGIDAVLSERGGDIAVFIL